MKTDEQTGRQRVQAEGQTEKYIDGQTDGLKERKTIGHKKARTREQRDRQRHRQRGRQKEGRDRETDRWTSSGTDIYNTYRETDRLDNINNLLKMIYTLSMLAFTGYVASVICLFQFFLQLMCSVLLCFIFGRRLSQG